MTEIRPTAVAGSFYPADPIALRQDVDQLLASVPAASSSNRQPKVLVAPHAGYNYSGSLAAACYAPLANFRDKIKRVVLLGPSHRVAFKGIAAPTSTAFATPFGDVPIDSEAIAKILSLDETGFFDDAHKDEHSLEVHLPFLQRVLGEFSLVPLVVGDARPEPVAAALEALWGDESTLIVISTDLSHFHPYDEALVIDRNTADKILQLDFSLAGEEACGCRPLNGLLKLARARQLEIEEVGILNSGDSAGDQKRVVGYGGYRLFESIGVELSPAARQQIIHVARQSIYHGLTNSETLRLEPNLFDPVLLSDGACFITLKLHDQLRGCIGSLEAHRMLLLDVAQNAQSAAFKDPRFSRLSASEYSQMTLEVSILSQPSFLGKLNLEECLNQIRPHVDGLIISEAGKRATYLPSVWQQLPEPADFLRSLRNKAGLHPNQWNQCEVWRYTTTSFE
jgi:AmmeMemoRadiSam system protein B/AmmeMemoRadiSam system protein A